jgi:hypothetical protein
MPVLANIYELPNLMKAFVQNIYAPAIPWGRATPLRYADFDLFRHINRPLPPLTLRIIQRS